jgi:cysteine-S-conjugate beta-lyase
MKLETILSRLSENSSIKDQFGASHIPIYQTATFDLQKQSGERIYEYSRSENPTRSALEEIFALAEEGQAAVCTSTGVGAVSLLFDATLKAGDSVLAEIDCYGGTFRSLELLKEKFGIQVTYMDLTNYDAVEQFLKSHKVTLAIFESPTNPGLKILDIKRLSDIFRKYGALTAIDNSLATFASQKPLTLGVDFSLFSATKYISGHSATIAGAVVAKDKSWGKKLRFFSNAGGRAQGPFEAFLVSLGLPTLIYRMKAQEAAATEIALYLETRKEIAKVVFPFLESHPQHELARRQMSICPGVITIETADENVTKSLVSRTKLFGEKASFGSADSRIEQPMKISHASYTKEALDAIGITPNTIRLSIGLEHVDDLIEDLASALC